MLDLEQLEKWRKENIEGNPGKLYSGIPSPQWMVQRALLLKNTFLLCIKMFNTAPLLSYSSPNIDDSWHNSLDYRWVTLWLDRLWCNSDRTIVTWILMLHTWDFRFWYLGSRHRFLGLYRWSNGISVNHEPPSLLLPKHRNSRAAKWTNPAVAAPSARPK